jgi:hypothetical protein
MPQTETQPAARSEEMGVAMTGAYICVLIIVTVSLAPWPWMIIPFLYWKHRRNAVLESNRAPNADQQPMVIVLGNGRDAESSVLPREPRGVPRLGGDRGFKPGFRSGTRPFGQLPSVSDDMDGGRGGAGVRHAH